MQRAAPPAAILAQLLSQLVARFLRFMQRWLFWLLLRFLLRIAMPQRRKKLSPHRRMKPVLSWKPVVLKQVGDPSDDWSDETSRSKMPGPWLRRWMTAVAGRAFLPLKGFRIALPRAFRKASWSTDFGTKREHRAVTTLPDGSICFASSSSRWWRYHGHPSVPWRQPGRSRGSWMNDEVSRESALEELLPRRWQRMLLAVIGRAIFYSTGFLCWRWLRGLFLRASLALNSRSKMVCFD